MDAMLSVAGAVQHFRDGDTVYRWRDCPDCDGRGWFLIRPFATGGGNGAGGLSNMMQCPKCREACLNNQAAQRSAAE